ncbi:hypothetical protein QZH41_002340 [Actinostola sp. cb2023]|nr:hypothetical protein QZH41_002340 [Actinostola sp. cb2023]
MVIELSLFISGCVSFVLACRFFYANSQDIQRSNCEIIPYVQFELEEILDIECGPKPVDWLICNLCLLVGILDIVFIIIVDVKWNAYFDFYGIHNFSLHISESEKIVYYIYIAVFVWVLMGAVVSCCIFFILTRDIARHVDATEAYIIEKARSFSEAKVYHEHLLNYSEDLIKKFDKWFTTHNVFFFFIMMCLIFKWFLITDDDSKLTKHHILWASQISASFLIAFKFSFPFLSASRATARFQKMYFNINKRKVFQNIYEMPRFLEYAERCNFGFVVFGVKITTNMAFFTIATTFIGIFKSLAD